ncbi:hypothetical protein L1049_027035 [Liquidambar formosana]|uniref:Uncharacterized protein n=1 Tax=Liquidambar formosana TaxID=63359 RepID=A0AAP0NI63_LIQFO
MILMYHIAKKQISLVGPDNIPSLLVIALNEREETLEMVKSDGDDNDDDSSVGDGKVGGGGDGDGDNDDGLNVVIIGSSVIIIVVIMLDMCITDLRVKVGMIILRLTYRLAVALYFIC